MEMPIIRKLFVLVLLVTRLVAQSPSSESAKADEQITGVWRGNSTCLVKDSPCRDETNVYRISRVAQKPGRFLVAGSKIVDGKEILMGSGEWKYDAQKHTLESDSLPGGVIKLIVDGDKMDGTLARQETPYRRIHLQKEK